MNAHQEVWEQEQASLNGTEPWERWVEECERVLGHSLDGNQSTDGYSLDQALEWFLEGLSPAQYAAAVPMFEFRKPVSTHDHRDVGDPSVKVDRFTLPPEYLDVWQFGRGRQ